MFTKQSLKNALSLMKATEKEYSKTETENIKICISKGNRKIGRVLNVSLPPVLTCANCKECKNYCYDIKACLQYPKTVIDARIRNYILMKYNPEKYFSDIRKACKGRKKNKFFRWHVAGDIPSMEYFQNMIQIARDFPDFIFWTYTKNYSLVNQYCEIFGKESIPANLSIMFSEWKGMPIENPYNFQEFRCLFPDEKPAEGFTKCPGNCEVCTSGKTGCPYGKNMYVDLH